MGFCGSVKYKNNEMVPQKETESRRNERINGPLEGR